MTKQIDLTTVEARKFSELLTVLHRAERDVKVAFAFLIAKAGLEDATLHKIEGQTLFVEVPE